MKYQNKKNGNWNNIRTLVKIVRLCSTYIAYSIEDHIDPNCLCQSSKVPRGVDTSHSWILLLLLAGGVSGGDPDLVHLHSLLAAVLLTSLAETAEDIVKM